MKSLYSRFLAASPGRLHFAAHSHHPWPDVTRDAQIQAWDDAARLADLKWDHILGSVMKEAQAHIAFLLDFESPEQIAFAPNTHEFVVRLLSCFPPGRRLRVVTTDSEFMSFTRQTARLEEDDLVEVIRVPTEPFATFKHRFIEAIRSGEPDLVFFSQVFFNSGFVVKDFDAIVAATPSQTMVVIDGYHSFFAVPTSLRRVADRAFFLGGGYKYAQSGEGVCFLVVPKGFDRRPLNTGWFAGFGSLEGSDFARVGFSNDGFRFMGATFDPAGLYRFNAVAQMLRAHDLSQSEIHAHVKTLQRRFLDLLGAKTGAAIASRDLIAPEDGLAGLGHFLSFRSDGAGALVRSLAERDVIVDHRGDRVRIGFGLYQDAKDVEALVAHL